MSYILNNSKGKLLLQILMKNVDIKYFKVNGLNEYNAWIKVQK